MDYTFAGKAAEFDVIVEQDKLEEDVKLRVSVSFQMDAPEFDMNGYEPDPIKCGDDSSAEWTMTLPKIISADTSSVSVELVTTGSGFTFNGVDTVSLGEEAD